MSSDIILNNLDASETQRVVRLAAIKAVENGSLVALLRSPYGHYSSILEVAANHIEELHSKIKALEAEQPIHSDLSEQHARNVLNGDV